MKRSIFVIMVCLVLRAKTDGEKDVIIKVEDYEDKVTFICENGKWFHGANKLNLDYTDIEKEYTCSGITSPVKNSTILVKFRTCDNCIQLDIGPMLGIIIGDVLATALIGVAVYIVASQPTVRTYGSSYSKASDRQNLIQNQQNDTYTPLRPGQSGEYSQLERRANRK